MTPPSPPPPSASPPRSSLSPSPSPSPASKDAEIRRLVAAAEALVRPPLQEGADQLRSGQVGLGQGGESARVRGRRVVEWLRRRHERRSTAEFDDSVQQLTGASCDASGEYSSSGADSSVSSGSEELDCSVVTCHEVTPPTGWSVTNQESAPHQAILQGSYRLDGEATPKPLTLNFGHVTDTSVPALTLETPTPTSSPGSMLVWSPPSQDPANSVAAGPGHPSKPTNETPTWTGRRRARARRPMAPPSSSSEGGAPGSPTWYRRRAPRTQTTGEGPTVGERSHQPEVPAEAANRRHSHAASCGTTDATLEDLTASDVMDDSNDVIGSVSEQAWDPYQEYEVITDLGSESAIDPEALMRLLDCDDYRTFLDSVSDCASSQVSGAPFAAAGVPATAHLPSPPPLPPPQQQHRRARRKARASGVRTADSDSDADSAVSELAVLRESRRRLLLAQAELQQLAAQPNPICSGVLTVCRTELARLEQLLTLLDPLGHSRHASSVGLRPGVADIICLTQQWVGLRGAAMELQQRADTLGRLQERVRSLRHALLALDERTASAGRDLTSTDDLQARISRIQVLHQELVDRKEQLININADVHGHVTALGLEQETCPLKEHVVDLYRTWDEVSHRCQAQAERLTAAAATWRQFLAARSELSTALAADRRRLGVLRQALQPGHVLQGDVSADDVTEGQLTADDVTGVTAGGDADDAGAGYAQGAAGVSGAEPLLLWRLASGGLDDFSEGTSGYDSACSDELSERERRLGRLRRMAGDLESLLKPGGEAWSDIKNTLSTATSGLRELQHSCRQLVVKTTASQLLQQQLGRHGIQQGAGPVARRRSSAAARREMAAPSSAATAAAAVASGPIRHGGGGRRGQLRRALRAALPLQLGLLLCLCVACLLEPRCCEDINSLAMSLTPQLRYAAGPPPI